MESRDKSIHILARTLFKQLISQGYDHRHVVTLATALLDQVTTSLAEPRSESPALPQTRRAA